MLLRNIYWERGDLCQLNTYITYDVPLALVHLINLWIPAINLDDKIFYFFNYLSSEVIYDKLQYSKED